jgi:hypothetical protein
MKSRIDFAKAIAPLELTSVDRAIALLWFYRESQLYEERTASELATDMHEEGFSKPNVSRLDDDLRRSRYTVRGTRNRAYRVALAKLEELQDKYGKLAAFTRVEVQDSILPAEWFRGTRPYLERLVHQINGSYQYGFYDGCAALCRRLMESLIIDTYIHNKRHQDIQVNGTFLTLEKLISKIRSDAAIALGRNTPKAMDEIKALGDTAAHDRTYIAEKLDLDDLKMRYRRMIGELMGLAGIRNIV